MTETTPKEPTTASPTTPGRPVASEPKTATITLTAGAVTLAIRAHRLSNGTAETFVTTTDAAKVTTRGMTQVHSNFQAAKAATHVFVDDGISGAEFEEATRLPTSDGRINTQAAVRRLDCQRAEVHRP